MIDIIVVFIIGTIVWGAVAHIVKSGKKDKCVEKCDEFLSMKGVRPRRPKYEEEI